MPLTQPEMRGKISSPRFARISVKDVHGGPNGSMFLQRALQTNEEGLLQDAEAHRWIGSRGELFAQILRSFSPKGLHIHMDIAEFTCRNAQESKRAAGFEMHAHDVLPRINEQWPRVRPGKECP